jgi:hypothetical protein
MEKRIAFKSNELGRCSAADNGCLSFLKILTAEFGGFGACQAGAGRKSEIVDS